MAPQLLTDHAAPRFYRIAGIAVSVNPDQLRSVRTTAGGASGGTRLIEEGALIMKIPTLTLPHNVGTMVPFEHDFGLGSAEEQPGAITLLV